MHGNPLELVIVEFKWWISVRRNVLVSGIFLTFLGLVFIVASNIAVQPKPLWETEVLDETRPDQPADSLSVQGDLSNGDMFAVGFTITTPPGIVHADAAVLVDITDPDGHNSTYEIPIGLSPEGKPRSMSPFPEGTANKTGLHKVYARGIWFVRLDSLVFEKKIPKEPEYPYRMLLPVGIAAITGGVGTSLLGAKSSRPRKMRSKRRSLKRKR